MSLFSFTLIFALWVTGTAKSTIQHVLYFCLSTPREFFTIVLADGFSLEFEWQQVSFIWRVSFIWHLTFWWWGYGDAVVWMVSTRPLTSNSSSPFNNSFVTVAKAPITIVIIVIFMFISFFNSLARSRYLSFFFIFFQYNSVVSRYSKVHNFTSSLFFCWLLWVLVFWPRLGDPSVCQSPIGVNVHHSPGQMLGCAYTICLYSEI